MKSIDAYKKLLNLEQPIITTVDAATCLNLKIATASKMLERFVHAKILFKIKRKTKRRKIDKSYKEYLEHFLTNYSL